MIGTVGSPAKAELARAHGCDHVINYATENFTQRVRDITGGEGVAVVYDGVGKDTFTGSLDSLRPMGMMVSYGNASGPVPPVDLILLSQKGSLFITRPTLMTYTARRADLLELGRELFDRVASGQVRIEVNQRYALRDAAQAHRDLEARKTTGSNHPAAVSRESWPRSKPDSVAARPVCHRLVDFPDRRHRLRRCLPVRRAGAAQTHRHHDRRRSRAPITSSPSATPASWRATASRWR